MNTIKILEIAGLCIVNFSVLVVGFEVFVQELGKLWIMTVSMSLINTVLVFLLGIPKVIELGFLFNSLLFFIAIISSLLDLADKITGWRESRRYKKMMRKKEY